MYVKVITRVIKRVCSVNNNTNASSSRWRRGVHKEGCLHGCTLVMEGVFHSRGAQPQKEGGFGCFRVALVAQGGRRLGGQVGHAGHREGIDERGD